MSFFEVFESIGAAIVAAYVWYKRNDKVGATLVCIAMLVFVIDFGVRTRFEQDLPTHLAARSRFCQSQKNSMSCFLSFAYEKYRGAHLSQVPDQNICNFCKPPTVYLTKEIISYVPLKEDSLLNADLPDIRDFIDKDIDVVKLKLGKMLGMDDVTSLPTSQITTSIGPSTQYHGDIRYDNFFNTLTNYDRKCVNSSSIRLLVVATKVKTITWIGDLKKSCFETLWLPTFARQADFHIDERLREDTKIDTVIRYFDYDDARLLIVSSRPLINGKEHVGMRVSLVSSSFPQNNAYDDNAARGIFKDPQDIAAL